MIIWHMRVALWVNMATYTHSHYVTLLDLQDSNGYANASQGYLTCKMPVSTWKKSHLFLPSIVIHSRN
jgi:hypothetical protein